MENDNILNQAAFQNLSADKLKFLSEFIQQDKPTSSKDMASFLSGFAGKAQNEGISFSNNETDFIIEHLMQNMNPQERQKANMILQLMRSRRK